MLHRVILKNFRYNLKNYLLFFFSNTLAVALVLLFLGLKYNLTDNIQNEGTKYILNMDFLLAVFMLSAVSVFLLVYSVRNYLRLRIRDYSMLLMLGVRRKLFQTIIFAEYGLGWLMSVLAGGVCGTLVYYGFQEVLYRIDSESIQKTAIGVKSYGYTFLISGALVLAVVLIMLTIMEGKDLDSFAAGKELQEKRVKNWKWIFLPLAGIGLAVCGNRKFPEGEGGILAGNILWVVSALLIMFAGGSLLLEFLKKRKKFYYRNLLRLTQMYHHFTSNYMVIFMLFVIHFFALGYVASGLAECFPLTVDRERYPYDYIWSAAEEDLDFISRTAEEFGGTVETVPIIKVASWNTLDQFGISESTYRELTGREANLEENEVLVIQEGDQWEKIENESAEYAYQYIHFGRYRGENVLKRAYQDFGYEEADKKEFLSGNIIGRLLDGFRDGWIVMTDDRFQEAREELKKEPDEPVVLALFQIPEENREEAGEKLEEYVSLHGLPEEGNMQDIFYDVNNIIEGMEKQKLFQVSSKVFILLLLMFSSVFILKMKAMSDENAQKIKYTFLYTMGMKKKARRKHAGFEVSCVAAVPLVLGVVYGINYNLVKYHAYHISGDELPRSYVMVCLAAVALYILFQAGSMNLTAFTTGRSTVREE